MTMTDRELLERAAKAAGTGPLMNEPYGLGGTRYFYREDDYPSGTTWNPLTDDGDALRRAVKLGLLVHSSVVEAVAQHYVGYASGWLTVKEPNDGDSYAATRRAIVRAAAAMAKED